MEARSSSQSTLNPPVFFGSAILIIALVLLVVSFFTGYRGRGARI